MRAEDVLVKNQDRLMAIPGVVGVGLGESQGAPAILVMVNQLTPELKTQIPRQLDGVNIKIEESGEIMPL